MKPLIQTINFGLFFINPEEAVKQIRNALETTGFFFLANHGMDMDVIREGEENFKKFLTELPLKERMIFSYPEKGYQIGYTPPKIETGEFAKVADEKHFFHVYPDDMPAVTQIPTFNKSTVSLWDEFHKLSKDLMKFIALSINEPENFFESKDGKIGYSLLRGLHYPAGQKPVDDDEEVTHGGNAIGMCASKHTDINMITLLLAKEPGLQLWHNNKWVPITITNPNLLIVNGGDMLQHLTNGVYKSGLHRVVCEPERERFSIPFFYHVPNDFDISPLPQFGQRKAEYKFQLAGDFLDDRLKVIGLVK